MSYVLPEESNPFEAPRSRIGTQIIDADGLDLTEAEVIRRAHIMHEASIKSLGVLCYLFGFFALLGTIGLIVVAVVGLPNAPRNNPALPPEAVKLALIGGGIFYFFLTVLYLGVGFGLRRLQVWSRWTMLVLTSLGLLYVLGLGILSAVANPVAGLFTVLLGSLIPGYILYLMASSKSGMVFSAPYKLIILKTPHVKPKTSLAAKIILGLLVALIVFIIAASVMNSR